MRLTLIAVILVLIAGCSSPAEIPPTPEVKPEPPTIAKNLTDLPSALHELLPFALEYRNTAKDSPNVWQDVNITSTGAKLTVDAYGNVLTGLGMEIKVQTNSGEQISSEAIVDADGRMIREEVSCVPHSDACERYSIIFSPGNPGPYGLHGREYFDTGWLEIHNATEQVLEEATLENNWLNFTSVFDRRLATVQQGLQSGSFHYGRAGPFADTIETAAWKTELTAASFGNGSVELDIATHPTLPPHQILEPFAQADSVWATVPISVQEAWDFLMNFELGIGWGGRSCVLSTYMYHLGPSTQGQLESYLFQFDVYDGMNDAYFRHQAHYHENLSGIGIWELGPKDTIPAQECSQAAIGGNSFLSITNLTKELTDQSWWMNHVYHQIHGIQFSIHYGDMYHSFLRVPPEVGISTPMNIVYNERTGALYVVEGPPEELDEMNALLRDWHSL